MKKRYTVLGLSLVLALALAVPAFGGPTNPLASASKGVQSIANQALKKAKAAQKAAAAAQTTANTAEGDATSAGNTANAAQKEASAVGKEVKTAQSTANSAKSAAEAAATTANAAKTAAAAAQSAANAAQATANTALATAQGKMSGEVRVEGTAGTTSNSAACPEGKIPTGGGYIVSGADANKATVIESDQYLSAWITAADQISGTTGSNWSITAMVDCATSP
jgi:hypothetical protein